MRTDTSTTRRAFLKRSLAVSGLALPCFVSADVLGMQGAPGANERVHIGVTGIGARGRDLIANVPEAGRVVAVCDCYTARTARVLRPDPASAYAARLQRFWQNDATRCTAYQDFRRMIEKEKLDAVIISVPDHNHIRLGILACQAGLDLYAEKPLSLTIAEGRALVRAVHRYGRVCQVGSQQRSMEMNRFACQLVREGGIGKVSLVQTSNFPGPMRYEGLPEEPVPPGMDWDLFCGPTPLRPYNLKLWDKDEFQVDGKLWRAWDLFRSYSGHLMTNWGAHAIDQIQWALGMDDTGPVEVWPVREGYTGEMRFCPVSMRYANGIEVRAELDGRAGSGGIFHGENGKIEITRNRFVTNPPDLVKNPPGRSAAAIWQGQGIVARPHIQNWLDCIQSRGTPNAPVETGHRSVTVCHLAGIARELGRRLRWDPAAETFAGDDEANALLDRPRRRGYELPNIT